MAVPHIPLLRMGTRYESLDTVEVKDHRNGEVLARMSVANPGLIRRDMRDLGARKAALARISAQDLVAICRSAGELFLKEALPLGSDGSLQTPDDYVRDLSRSSGLPHYLCRDNMGKVHYVLTHTDVVLKGLLRGLDLAVLDESIAVQDGLRICFYPTTDSLGVVLPSNSPGVNSLWVPSIPLKTPVVLKPGSEEPWTPWRIIAALLAAGCPGEALGFYPTTHEGAANIMDACGRAIIFGDGQTVERYRARPEVNVHGPGYSKILIGEDRIDDWASYLDMLVDSVMLNSGRSCVNVSTIMVPRHGRAIAAAVARRMADTRPMALDDPAARLSAFANPKMAAYIDGAIEEGLATAGAEEMTAAYRDEARLVQRDGSSFLHPTLIYCESLAHPLALREFMCPYVAVVEVPVDQMLASLGPSLVVTAVTRDRTFIDGLLRSPHIDRLNVGEIATPRVQWDQPHEGNLFEFLYRRRSIQFDDRLAAAG